MGRLSGKVALVTGGAVGIGAACVRRLREAGAQEGDTVYIGEYELEYQE